MRKNENFDINAYLKSDAPALAAEGLTKDYGSSRGIFDVTFTVPRGQMVGYVGTNGSGKTTTLRHLMGFLKPDSGSATVLGMDSWERAYDIKRYVAYVSGEIAFPGVRTGEEFLSIQAQLAGVKDVSLMHELISALQLDVTASLKRMSKGMKQKTALVAALMTDAPILILDEPTTGLDPLMRDTFVEIMLGEKAKGKTIIMSSQLFDEVEQTCDRVLLINGGRIIDDALMSKIKNEGVFSYNVSFGDPNDYRMFLAQINGITRKDDELLTATVDVRQETLNAFFAALDGKNVKAITQTKYDFEGYFNSKFSLAGGNGR